MKVNFIIFIHAQTLIYGLIDTRTSTFSCFKNFQFFYYWAHLLVMYVADKRINWKDTYFAIFVNIKIPRIFIPLFLCDVSIEHGAPAISRECLYSTIFRLRFIAGLLSSRLSNCSLDFSQPLVFIALSSRTLSPKGASRSVEILLLDVRVCACMWL